MTTTICITGMHRSGTSLVTSWLERCGLVISDGELVGVNAGNDFGHFEDFDFVRLDADVIRKDRPQSKGWIIFSQHCLSFDELQKSVAQDYIKRRNNKFETWGWKDPRAVFLLEEWKALIPDLKILLLWRPFCDVVNSLVKRSRIADIDVMKISLFQAARLWLAYNARVISLKEHFENDSLLLPIGSVIEADQRSINLINKRFGTQFSYSPLNKIYDPNKFHFDKSSLVIRTLGHYYRVEKMQDTLMALSDQYLVLGEA